MSKSILVLLVVFGIFLFFSGETAIAEKPQFAEADYPLIEEFDSDTGFTSTDPDVYIQDGKVHWTIYNNSPNEQYIYRSIPAFSGDVRVTVTGQVDSATNNCKAHVGIGNGTILSESVGASFGWFGGGCPVNGYEIRAVGASLDLISDGCSFTSDGTLWINGGTQYTATLTITDTAKLSVPEVGSFTGTPLYEGPYNTLYVGSPGGGDYPSCSGSIERVIVEPLSTVPTYSISGQVTDSSDNPISGATISDGAGHSTTTNSSGNYTLSGLSADTYTLTPALSGYSFSPITSPPISVPPSKTGVDFIGTPDSGIDFSIDAVIPIQVLEESDYLVRDKETGVKVVIRKDGSFDVKDVSVQLTYDSTVITTFYVAEKGNLDSDFMLVEDNSGYELDFSTEEITKTVYFFGDNLAPTGTTYQVSATVDYLDTDDTNNTENSETFSVVDTKWSGAFDPDLSIRYFKTDWGSEPFSDFYNFFLSSEDFLQGVYPISDERFKSSYALYAEGDTSIFRGSDGLLDEDELRVWTLGVYLPMQLAHPITDRFVATVPVGWFYQNTIGKNKNILGFAYPNLPGFVMLEARTSQVLNGTSIVAHEIGHTYQLDIECEEYEDCNKTRMDEIGNYSSGGLWVEKRIPINITNLRKVYCFMGANSDNEYWVDLEDYSTLLNDHKDSSTQINDINSSSKTILVAGTIDITDTVTLENWYILSEAEQNSLIPGPYSFVYLDENDSILHELSFDVIFKVEGINIHTTPFAYKIPYVEGTTKIVIKKNDIALADKEISPNAPNVILLSPNGNEILYGKRIITWLGDDADGDTLFYTIFVSPDNGVTWEPIAGNIITTNYLWDVSTLPKGSQYKIKIIATDGINVGQDSSNNSFSIVDTKEIFLPLAIMNHSSSP